MNAVEVVAVLVERGLKPVRKTDGSVSLRGDKRQLTPPLRRVLAFHREAIAAAAVTEEALPAPVPVPPVEASLAKKDDPVHQVFGVTHFTAALDKEPRSPWPADPWIWERHGLPVPAWHPLPDPDWLCRITGYPLREFRWGDAMEWREDQSFLGFSPGHHCPSRATHWRWAGEEEWRQIGERLMKSMRKGCA